MVTSQTATQYVLPVDATYEADVWGRVRQSVAAGRAGMQSSAADLETVRLSVHAEVAADYLQVRAIDTEATLLQASVDAFQKALDLTTNLYNAGVAARSDVAQAQEQVRPRARSSSILACGARNSRTASPCSSASCLPPSR